jgi:hypothetical protein
MKYLSPYSLLVLALFSCGELGHVNPNDPQFNIEPPEDLLVDPISDSEVELTWSDKSEHELGFRIERDSGNGFSQVAELNTNETNYIDVGLHYGTDYIYRVAGYTNNNQSDWVTSGAVNTTLGAPNNLTVSTISNMEVKLTWVDNCSFEGGFRIERNAGPGFEVITELNANVTQYTDVGLEYDITYTYRVVAFTVDNNSEYSNTEIVLISSFEGMWIGTWKLTGTTNQYSDSQLSMNETLTFANVSFDGSNVSGTVTMVSIYHGIVSGSFTYNPTGQTLIFNYSENPYEESFNGVVIDVQTLNFSNNDYSFNLVKQVNVTAYDAATWDGTWVVTLTTNQYSDSQLNDDEAMTFSGSAFDGTIVSGMVSLVSIYHGQVIGEYTYNPTGKTLVINYNENPYEESFNGVSIDDIVLNFSNSDYDFTLNKQESVNTYNASLWSGTWKVTSTTNQFSDSQLGLNETLTFTGATFSGVEVTGNTAMISVYHGSVSGPFTFNPTARTLIVIYTENPYEESFNGVVMDETTLTFFNNDYEFTLTKQ